MPSFIEFVGNAFNWIKNAIRAIWHIFKVIIKSTIKLITSFLHIIGDFIKNILSEIRRGLKKVFVIKNKKSDFKTIITDAKNEGKIKQITIDEGDLFGTTEKTDYDYSIVVTDNDFNPEKIETISAEELDKKIGQTYSEEVSEINIK